MTSEAITGKGYGTVVLRVTSSHFSATVLSQIQFIDREFDIPRWQQRLAHTVLQVPQTPFNDSVSSILVWPQRQVPELGSWCLRISSSTAGWTFLFGTQRQVPWRLSQSPVEVPQFEFIYSVEDTLAFQQRQVPCMASTKSLREEWSMLSLLLLRTPREGSPPTSACSSEDTLRCNVCGLPCSAESKLSGRESCLL